MEEYNTQTKQRVIILFGPPGAGKGTQAAFLEDRFGFHHIETSRILEQAFTEHGTEEEFFISGASYSYEEERQRFVSGELVTPEVVHFLLEEAVRNLRERGKSIIFSGSPRTVFEAQALYPVLDSLFGKDNCAFVHLVIPGEFSIARNTRRMICVACRLPHRSEAEFIVCRRCGGELRRRGSLDTADVIVTRLHEYRERTLPVVEVTKKFGIPTAELDARANEEIVFHTLQSVLGLDKGA